MSYLKELVEKGIAEKLKAKQEQEEDKAAIVKRASEIRQEIIDILARQGYIEKTHYDLYDETPHPDKYSKLKFSLKINGMRKSFTIKTDCNMHYYRQALYPLRCNGYRADNEKQFLRSLANFIIGHTRV